MKITDISVQARNPNRVNVSVDGKYRLSLDIHQVGELGLKVGKEYTESDFAVLEEESQFGKLYARTLEYSLMRPHSAREVRDYLWKKTLTRKIRKRNSTSGGKHDDIIIERPGVSKNVTERVFNRLVERDYINDEKFAQWWVDNRNRTKGTSLQKLRAELASKGVDKSITQSVLADSDRTDSDELAKIIAKKRAKYTDDQKFIAYLARQGFAYDEIRTALEEE